MAAMTPGTMCPLQSGGERDEPVSLVVQSKGPAPQALSPAAGWTCCCSAWPRPFLVHQNTASPRGPSGLGLQCSVVFLWSSRLELLPDSVSGGHC